MSGSEFIDLCTAGVELVPMTLVPVEVFGAEDGYGLMDAVGPGFSDCNRAEGRIYRVEDLEPTDGYMHDEGRQVRVRVFVHPDDVEWFKRRWSGDHAPHDGQLIPDSDTRCPTCRKEL